MTVADVAIIGLAAWRLAHFIVHETGPGGLMRWIRERFGIKYDDDGNLESFPERLPATLLLCVWCTSAWTSILTFGVWMVAPMVVGLFAVWGAASALESIVGRTKP